jgi:Mg2+ and Co2+ transporter CorA
VISVALLTKIGIIYTLLNFTASVFGMDIAKFGNKVGRLWIFVINTLIFASITAVPFVSQVIN